MGKPAPISELNPANAAPGVRWIREWKEEGLADFRIGRDGEDLVAEWVGKGVLRASRSGERKQFVAFPGVDSRQVEKFHRGLVNAMVRHLEGKVTLHASGIALAGLAVALTGPSRSGKSTTTASLCRHADVEMLADDTLAIERGSNGYLVAPTEDTHWLPEDSAIALGVTPGTTFKAHVAATRCARGPVPLAAIVKLVFDAASPRPRLRAIQGREAFQILNRSLFRFIIDEPPAAIHDLEELSSLCAEVQILELVRRPSLDDLAACYDLIRGLAEDLRRKGAWAGG
jgi:hypothetical protein